MEKTTCRDARIDIMRAVAMLMIVCGHFINHGINHVTSPFSPHLPFLESPQGVTNFCLLQFLGYATCVGTNLFFMITGYFLVKPRTISYAISKAFNIWKIVVFYSVGVYALLSLTELMNFSMKGLICQVLPIHSRNYWFMSNYIVLILMSPFMAKLFYTLNKREYQVLLLLFFCITFDEKNIGYGHLFSGNMSLGFDVALFAWGGYLKRFPFKEFKADYLLFFAFYIAICLALASNSFVEQILSSNFSSTSIHIRSMGNNSLPLLYATCFFLAATSQKYHVPTYVSKAAIRISPYILAVYLIHDNPLLRPILWDDIVKPLNFICSYWMIPYSFAVAISIFVVCVFVEYIRQRITSATKAVRSMMSI